jgi:2-haloacid dehalogenase
MAVDGIDWITFDCYGTLIDWEGGFGGFLYAIALRSGDQDPPPGERLQRRLEDIQFEIIQGPYKTYKEILAESLRAWCDEFGYPWVDGYADAITMTMRSMQPFHDTRPALERARAAGLNLAILSNSDHDIISHSIKHVGIPFEHIVTAEDCRSYKPSLSNFERLLATIGAPAEQALHVAFGFKYDIGPARQLGFRTAWVNRNAEPLPDRTIKPDYTWRDLWGLAEFAGRPYDV